MSLACSHILNEMTSWYLLAVHVSPTIYITYKITQVFSIMLFSVMIVRLLWNFATAFSFGSPVMTYVLVKVNFRGTPIQLYGVHLACNGMPMFFLLPNPYFLALTIPWVHFWCHAWPSPMTNDYTKCLRNPNYHVHKVSITWSQIYSVDSTI